MTTRAARKYSIEIPWVLVEGSPGAFGVVCSVCGERAYLDSPNDVAGFAYAHAEHTAGEGYLGMGDAVAAIAKPVAKFFGQAPCTPCEARRRALNQARVRFPW